MFRTADLYLPRTSGDNAIRPKPPQDVAGQAGDVVVAAIPGQATAVGDGGGLVLQKDSGEVVKNVQVVLGV